MPLTLGKRKESCRISHTRRRLWVSGRQRSFSRLSHFHCRRISLSSRLGHTPDFHHHPLTPFFLSAEIFLWIVSQHTRLPRSAHTKMPSIVCHLSASFSSTIFSDLSTKYPLYRLRNGELDRSQRPCARRKIPHSSTILRVSFFHLSRKTTDFGRSRNRIGGLALAAGPVIFGTRQDY